MTHIKSILAALLVAIAFAVLPGSACATNYQDLWWNPNESGWGINISHQGDVMFATWFFYGASSQPTWIFLSRAERSGASGNIFTGDIFQATSGSPFSAVPFVPSPSGNFRPVGTARFVFSDARTATLTYTVDGAQVVKQLTRQFIGGINLTGTYYGGLFRTAACPNSGVSNSIYSVVHLPAPASSTITEVGGNLCRFTGVINQFGSSFEGGGNYTCAGEVGTWTGTEGTGGESAFSIKLALQTGAGTCNTTFGGFKSP
jgi:hypothetical protein